MAPTYVECVHECVGLPTLCIVLIKELEEAAVARVCYIVID